MAERLRGGPPIRERGPEFVETGEYGLGAEEEDDMDADDFALVLSTKPEPSLDVGGIVFDCRGTLCQTHLPIQDNFLTRQEE
jgi:hypothetical protein